MKLNKADEISFVLVEIQISNRRSSSIYDLAALGGELGDIVFLWIYLGGF